MRIVSLVPGGTETIAALGLEDRLVGVTHSCDHPPGVAGLPRVTSTSIPEGADSGEIDRRVKESVDGGTSLYEIDIELLERLQPDLLVTQGVCDVCSVGESLAAACLPALSRSPTIVSLHPHRFEDVLDDLLRLGRATGTEHRAMRLVERYRARVASVRERVADRDRVGVVVLEWIAPLFSAGHWTPDLVELAGGRELVAQGGDRSRELEWSEVRDADPEALLVACCGQDVERSTEDLGHLRSLPGYEDLRAVRNGRVYVADGNAHFSRPGPRLVDSLELLAGMLHPEAFPEAMSASSAITSTTGASRS